jgi:hypothetical protein
MLELHLYKKSTITDSRCVVFAQEILKFFFNCCVSVIFGAFDRCSWGVLNVINFVA